MADLGGAGEGDLVDIHVPGNGSASGRTVARKNIDDAVWETRFYNQLADAQGGERRLLGGLENYGATGGESRTELPGLHQEWEIPRNDLADHAYGLVFGEREKWAVDRNGFSV